MLPNSTATWLRDARPGSCGVTFDFVEGDCFHGDAGSFRLTEAQSVSMEVAATACLRACALCERCRSITVGPKYKDCSWYHSCTSTLDTRVAGVMSGAGLPISSRQGAKCSQLAAATPSQHPGLLDPAGLAATGRRYLAWVEQQQLPADVLEEAVVLTADDQQVRALRRVLQKLSSRQPVRIAVIGGSLTYGHGVNRREDTWPEQMRRALSALWNTSEVSIHNGAKPATTAGFGALCYDTLVPFRPDLTIVEYSHNTAEAAKLELLLSTARQEHVPVLVLDYSHVHHHGAFVKCVYQLKRIEHAPAGSSRALHCPALTFGTRFEPQHTRFFPFLRASGVAALSFRAFGPWLSNARPRFVVSLISPDGGHLTARGYALLASLPVHFLWRESVRLATLPSRTDAGGTAFAPRRHGGSHECGRWRPLPPGRTSCVIGSQLQGRVLPCAAPSITCEWRYSIERGKPGLVTQLIGSILDLRVDLPARPSGQRNATAFAHLMYLQSYEHMGVARLSCEAGCNCHSLTIDAHDTARKDSLETVARPLWLRGPAGAMCVLRIQLLPRTSSGEHKFKVRQRRLRCPVAASLPHCLVTSHRAR